MSRWGGFRKGRTRYRDSWDQLKAVNSEREETVADTPQQFSYVEAQGIWNLRSTMQFPKSNAFVPLSLTFVASVTSLNQSVSVPYDAITGDIAIIYSSKHAFNVSSGNILPSGWTTVREDFDSADSVMMSGYKVLETGDLGQSVNGVVNSNYIAMLIFRPSRAVSSIATFSENGQATISNPSPQTINMSLAPADNAIIAVAFMSGTTAVAEDVPASMTLVSVDSDSHAFYQIFNPGDTPTNLTVDMPDEGDNVMQSWGLAVS